MNRPPFQLYVTFLVYSSSVLFCSISKLATPPFEAVWSSIIYFYMIDLQYLIAILRT